MTVRKMAAGSITNIICVKTN